LSVRFLTPLRTTKAGRCPLSNSRQGSERHLRDHLAIKLEKSNGAQRLQKDLFSNVSVVDQALSSWLSQLAVIRRLARGTWGRHSARRSIDHRYRQAARQFPYNRSLRGTSEYLASGWHAVPEEVDEAATSFAKMVAEPPDQTATVDAQSFLLPRKSLSPISVRPRAQIKPPTSLLRPVQAVDQFDALLDQRPAAERGNSTGSSARVLIVASRAATSSLASAGSC
jgi:hypothetical protein